LGNGIDKWLVKRKGRDKGGKQGKKEGQRKD